MGGWELALALVGCALAGAVLGILGISLYARHLFRRKFGTFGQAMLGGRVATTTGGQVVTTTGTGSGSPTNPPPTGGRHAQ